MQTGYRYRKESNSAENRLDGSYGKQPMNRHLNARWMQKWQASKIGTLSTNQTNNMKFWSTVSHVRDKDTQIMMDDQQQNVKKWITHNYIKDFDDAIEIHFIDSELDGFKVGPTVGKGAFYMYNFNSDDEKAVQPLHNVIRQGQKIWYDALTFPGVSGAPILYQPEKEDGSLDDEHLYVIAHHTLQTCTG